MSTTIHPDIENWVSEQRAQQAEAIGIDASDAEIRMSTLRLNTKDLTALIGVSAKLAAGFFRPTKRTEVVWVDGESELAVGMDTIKVFTANGLVGVSIPVRCDQTGQQDVQVIFAVGEPDRPAGAYASTYRRPTGPAAIVDVWGEALVAYAWQVVLGLTIQIAGAAGKDGRGSRFVPGAIVATTDGLAVDPIVRHRFYGSSGLKTVVRR